MEKLIIFCDGQGYNVKGGGYGYLSRLFIKKNYEEAEKQIKNIFVFCGQAHKAAFQIASKKWLTAQWQYDYQKALPWRLCIDWPRFLGLPAQVDIIKNFLREKSSYIECRHHLFKGRDWSDNIYQYNPYAYEIYKKAKQYEGEFFEGEQGAHVKYSDELSAYPPLLRRFMGQIYDCFFYDQKDFAIKSDEKGTVYVPTARGFLSYNLKYEKGCIKSCEIISPTDVHFHENSAFTQRGKSNLSISKAQLRLEILGLDPCMDWEIEENA